jgi:hypothetical protein
MIHGELKVKLFRSMLDLEAFTVAELAEHAGVEPAQTYGELASLKKLGFLAAKSIESSAQHRPLNIYHVTQDVDLRRQFINTHLSPRLLGAAAVPPGAITVSEDPDARIAHVLLDQIDLEISKLEAHPFPFFRRFPENAERQLDRIMAKLEQARTYLESAIYSLGIVDEDFDSSDEIVTVDSKRFQHFRGRAEQLTAAFQQSSLTLEAQQSFTDEILSPALRALEEPRKKNDSVIQIARRIWKSTANDVLRQMLAMFLTDLEVLKQCNAKERQEEYPKFLAAKAVRWCSSADVLTECFDRLTTNPETNDYNRVNSLFLQGNHDVAFNSWCRWTKAHMSDSCLSLTGAKYIQYPGVVIAFFEDALKAGEWSRDLEKSVGPSVSISIASFAAVDFPTLDQTPAVPTLFDPKSSRSEIRLAESLTQGLRPLFATGQLSQRLTLPGVPEIRLATVLFSIGVRPKDAWKAAARLNEKSVLVVVCSANPSSLGSACDAFSRPHSFMKHVQFYGENLQLRLGPKISLERRSELAFPQENRSTT